MSADDIKELKAITLQILKNQTLIIAHLVSQSQQSQQLQALKTVKMEPETLQQQQAKQKSPSVVAKAKRKAEETTAHVPLKEIGNGVNTGKRRRSCVTHANETKREQQLKNNEKGKNEAKETGATQHSNGGVKAGLISPNEHYCSICEAGVKTENLVQHIWEHIVKKVMAEKGDNAKIYSFVCDVKGCGFRTNKFEGATSHADKHPTVERNKVVVDNRENSEPLFLATLAQCYDCMTDAEKDEVYRKRYE